MEDEERAVKCHIVCEMVITIRVSQQLQIAALGYTRLPTDNYGPGKGS